MVGYTFRDAELASLPLRALNWAGAAAARLSVESPSLTPKSVISAACKSAGSSDLGGESYREPLERYLEAVQRDAQLNTFGRFAVRRMLVGSLANRIALHGWMQAHPDVSQERIESPWVIVGLPRTGTSLLSILLSLDPQSRALLHWEAARPVPPPDLAGAADDPRIAQNARELDGLLKLNPALRAMHPWGATLAQECVALFMLDVRTLGVESQAYVPSFGRWLQTCDMTPAYQQHRLALQALQSAQPTERWVLKSPNHLWCLETLLASYPDARIVWTHRDPGTVVTSLASLVNALQRPFTRLRDPEAVGQEWNRKTLHAISRGMAFDAERGDGWCVHLRYQDLVTDAIGAVRRIYRHFGETPGALHERRMEAWLRDRPQQIFGRHIYDPADFGWTYDALAEHYQAYSTRYDVPRERHEG